MAELKNWSYAILFSTIVAPDELLPLNVPCHGEGVSYAEPVLYHVTFMFYMSIMTTIVLKSGNNENAISGYKIEWLSRAECCRTRVSPSQEKPSLMQLWWVQ